MNQSISIQEKSQTEIEHCAMNFATALQMNDFSVSDLIQILSHPKVFMPPHNVFIDRIIGLLSKHPETADDYLPLFSFIDFSKASLQQLRDLSKTDKECYYIELFEYLKIRESEEDLNMKLNFIQKKKRQCASISIEYHFLNEELKSVQKENDRISDEINQLENEISFIDKKSKETASLLQKRKKKRVDIISREEMDPKLPNQKLLADLQNNLSAQKQEESVKTQQKNELEKKNSEEKQSLAKIEKIEKLKAEHIEAEKKEDNLKDEYKKLSDEFEELSKNQENCDFNEASFQKYIDELCQKAEDLKNSNAQKNSIQNKYYQAKFIVNPYSENALDEDLDVIKKI